MSPGPPKTCDGCRRRKSRCSHCTGGEIPCASNKYRRIRRTRQNVSMINRLESNLQRMEACLQDLGLDASSLNNDAHPSSLEGASERTHPSQTPTIPACGESSMTSSPEIENSLLDSLASYFVPRYLAHKPTIVGLSSILSQDEANHIQQNPEMLASLELLDRHCQSSSSSPLAEICPRKAFYPLPPKEEAMSLLHDYMQTVNTLCPLFQPSVLTSIFGSPDLDAMFRFPGHWACINIVLALGHIVRIKGRSVAQPDHQKSWYFIKNALGALTEICLGPPNLWAIQALIGMTFFLLGTPCAQPCSFLISTAINIAHQIGLERTDEESSTLDPEELEQRRRIFWIAYCIDREISLRFGCVPAQRDEDMMVSLPTEFPTDRIGLVPVNDGQESFNVFRSCCKLAIIKGHVYKRLYSASATDRPLSQTVAAVASLDEELQQWKAAIPSEYQPDSEFPMLLHHQSPECELLLLAHYSYFNCVISMHHLIVTRELIKEMDLTQSIGLSTSPALPSNSSVFMSASLCARAARDSIHMIKYMPEGNISIIGFLIHYAMIASKTLSFGILRNPNEASRLYDVKLISRVETFLSSLILSTPNEGVDRLVQYCAQYRSVAEAAIKQATKDCQH